MRSRLTARPASRAQPTACGTRAGSCVRSSVASTCGTADCIPNETRVNPAAASAARLSGDTESGFASVVTSACASSPNRSRIPPSSAARSPGGSNVGVPPPRKTVDAGRAGRPAASRTFTARSSSASAAAAYDAWSAPPPSSLLVYVLKSQ
jgi:hypothetical protein